ncbi:MAG: bifunctional DNA-formamidopyrimidine glycosylase/DNA-(apurinic or apyrimidinic site) lyase [Acidimicrobiales bacterium]|nr:bifunctional DNA-formamidopyrimidine glycosylase/DNA-(apurinic or apyrimidinic site) lyase [Acidimicrobiales bacterium]
MPELPEVETVRRDLAPFLTGRNVREVAITRDRAVRRQPHADFVAGLRGRTLTDVGRHGKYLFVALDGDEALVAHLRMSGQLRAARPADERAKHTHVVMDLDNGTQLRFVDPRTFGELFLDKLGPDGRPSALRSLGPDAVDPTLTSAALHDRLTQGRRASSIKAALLDQRAVAGVGNIYADEALFAARLHPLRPAASVTSAETGQLHKALRRILEAAIKARGSSLADYVDAYGGQGSFVRRHKVYARAGKPCTRCAAPIERSVVAQRGTHFCPVCQR